MTAIEAIRELARRWARQHVVDPEAILGGHRLRDRLSGLRDQFMVAVVNHTMATTDLLAEALQVHRTNVYFGRRRAIRRAELDPSYAARGLAAWKAIIVSDEVFAALILDLTCADTAARTVRANRNRADTLYRTSLKPGFHIGRLAAHRAYFDARRSNESRPRTRVQQPNEELLT